MTSLKIVIQVATCLLILFMGVAFGEFNQGNIDYVEVRGHLINEWSKGDPERERMASLFINECVTGKPVKPVNTDDLPPPPPMLTINECSKNNGTQKIVDMLDENKILKTTAWPLSIFTD